MPSRHPRHGFSPPPPSPRPLVPAGATAVPSYRLHLATSPMPRGAPARAAVARGAGSGGRAVPGLRHGGRLRRRSRPEAFRWFVDMAPGSYTATLGFIMLAMGLTLRLWDFAALLRDRPLSILFGCAAQYTITPVFGAIVSRALGLPPSLSAGLILLGCCPGGTASNVVTLVAKGDVPLSIVMTVCSTLAAMFLTPLLTKVLAVAYIPVDAVRLSRSTLQVVVAPIILGSSIQTAFPSVVQFVTPFAPLMAVLACRFRSFKLTMLFWLGNRRIRASFLPFISFNVTVSFSENFVRLNSTIADAPSVNGNFFSGDIGVVMLSVCSLHFAGFFVGYAAAAIGGLKEKQRRAISIEVGMQNSSLGVVLAATHFSSPLVALPPALSALIMNVMGSTLGHVWQYITPSDLENETTGMHNA